MTSTLRIHPASAPLVGSLRLPDDVEVALARLALGALARGKTTLRLSAPPTGPLLALLRVLSALGLQTIEESDLIGVKGQGLLGLTPPSAALDVRGEAAVGALLLGLLHDRPFPSEVLVDELVVSHLLPLLNAGSGAAESASVESLGEGRGARVSLAACKTDRPPGLERALPGVFPWIKWALLLRGLRASSETAVEEQLSTADHFERALERARVPVATAATRVTLHPPRDEDAIAPGVYEPLGSATLLPWFVALGLVVPGSRLEAREVSLHPGRSALLSLLRLSGVRIGISPEGERQGEPYGSVLVEGSLRAGTFAGELSLSLRDGILPLLAAAARADGESVFSELVPEGKGGDPRILGRVAGLLRSAGVEVELGERELRVRGTGGRPLRPLVVTTGGDGRLALFASLLALGADGPSTVDDVECLREVYPRWIGVLKALGVQVEVSAT